MFEGEVYPDFFLLFSLCHQSRVEILTEDRPEECWLEKWSKLAEEQGTRAREKLRVGVERAIQALGTGFRTARGNTALNEALRTGTLDTHEFYRELLRMVYRILLLLVAEDKRLGEDQNLLHPPDSTPEARRRYAQYYSLGRLRKLASQRRGTAHSDLYESLKVLFEKLRVGYAPLAIPGLGSFLFSPQTTPNLDAASLANEHLLGAIRHLCYTEDVSGRGGSVLRPVDFGNLGSEELGSVYESLLELHPRIDTDEGPFILAVAAGHERKTTGSYYTPTSLINCLLDSALDPVVLEALAKSNPEEALLNLKICDPACGSGHFLIAAAERMAKHLARLRTGDDEPSLRAIQHAKRDIIGRCIYGVDLNEMAAELCKVSLWMEAMEPGRPLSFLEHHIQVGNSLLGATPALLRQGIPDRAFEPIKGDDKAVCRDYRKQNRDERNRQTTMFDLFAKSETIRLSNITPTMARIETMRDDSIEAWHVKDEAYREFIKSQPYQFAKLLGDAWCAAFVIPKVRVPDLQPRVTLTESTLRKLENNPNTVPFEVRETIETLARHYNFFHWHLAFLSVFQAERSEDIEEGDILGWKRGFDVVIGNPPWERLKLQEREFFAVSRPDIANADTAAIREQLIAGLATQEPALFARYHAALRRADAEGSFVRKSGRFPLGASGDTNTYPLFIELATNIIQATGRAGLIVKTGILADYSLREFFDHLVQEGRLVSAFDFSNRNLIFPAVVANERFTLLTVAGPKCNSGVITISVLNEEVRDLETHEKVWRLTQKDTQLINPNTHTCPLFQTSHDAGLVTDIYRKHPILIKEGSGESNPWAVTYYTMFHMTNDSSLFRDMEALQSRSRDEANPIWMTNEGQYVALLEGKLYDLFDHRHGTFEEVPRKARFGIKAEPNHPSTEKKQQPVNSCLPRYWVPADEVRSRYVERLGFQPSGVLTFRDVCRTHTDLRTVRACICPPFGAGNKAPLFLFPKADPAEHARRSAFLCANLASFPLDYVARQKFSGGSLNRFIIIQFPFIEISAFDRPCRWAGGRETGITVADFMLPRIIELTYTAWDLASFARDCGYERPPFRWNDARRVLLRCELDAAFCHLYDLSRDNVDYILETFPILKRKDIQQFGDFRTKFIILGIYDAMQKAIETGKPYQILLDPPPADPRVAHPPREGDQ